MKSKPWKEISKIWLWLRDLNLLKKSLLWKKWPIKKKEPVPTRSKLSDYKWLNKPWLPANKEIFHCVTLNNLLLKKLNIVIENLILIPILIKIVKIPNNSVWCVVKMKWDLSTKMKEINVWKNVEKAPKKEEIGFGFPKLILLFEAEFPA